MTVFRALFSLLALCCTCASAFVVQQPCRKPFKSLFSSFDEYQVSGGETTVATKDLVMGTGEEVQDGDVVTVAYKGTVLQTTETFGEGKFRFKYGENKVMPGWNGAVEGMRLGGSRIAKIPPSLAFGTTGQANIPPNSDLEIKVELEEIQQGKLAEIAMEFGLGNNLKTYGLLFFTLVLALSPLLPV